MKRFLIVMLLAIINITFGQKYQIEDKFVFKSGDDTAYKMINYNDSQWSKISVKSHWENQGFANLDGFGWYRIKFSLDSKMLSKQLYLLAGMVDDADEAYVNGILVGKTGNFPPKASSEWNTQRIYKLPKGLLNKENTLAIRVFDMGGPGGIYGGKFMIVDEKGLKSETEIKNFGGKSFYQIPTTNGLIAGVYNEKDNIISAVYPHIFQAVDSSTAVVPFIKNIKLSIDEKPLKAYYKDNTHIIEVKYKNYTVNYFAPFSDNRKVFVIKVSSTKPLDAIKAEYGTNGVNVLTNDVIKGKNEKYFLFSFAGHEADIKAVDEKISKGNLFQDEYKFMRNIIAKTTKPKNLSKKEKDLFEQSVSVLKMSQVSQNEEFPKSRGQILASLPPGMWNICWIRDASYSIMALTKLGMYEEAKNALLFFANADAGYYKKYIHNDGKDYGIGSDYKISVCRYYGIGKEESDFNSDGPNVEIDGFGLYLKAITEYVKATGDTAIEQKRLSTIRDQIIVPILKSIDQNGLIRKESGSWERHLPGKQFAYTSIVCAEGLRDFGTLIQKRHPKKSKQCLDGYEKLVSGINSNLLTDGKYVRGTFENLKKDEVEHFDAASFEAFNFDIIKDKKVFETHYKEYEKALRISPKRGFARVNSSDWYDKKEWLFIDLRICNALRKFGMNKDAKTIYNWVVDQSSKNNNMIAELYDEKTAGYEGAVPMVGFGAGSYVLYVLGK